MVRNRKRLWLILLLTVLLAAALAGCGENRDAEETTVYLNEDGTIEQLLVETQESAELSETELESYIATLADAYREENGSAAVTVNDCGIQNGVIKVRLTYRSAADYAGFNGMTCFSGTLQEASDAGYLGDVTLLGTDGSSVAGTDLLSNGTEAQVLILEEPVQVQVYGTILYVTDGVDVTDTQTVKIGGSGSSGTGAAALLPETTDAPVCIVFQP